jgi:hypothetical protein
MREVEWGTALRMLRYEWGEMTCFVMQTQCWIQQTWTGLRTRNSMDYRYLTAITELQQIGV